MSIAAGFRNGFCFGIDIYAIDGDLVVQNNQAFIWDGIGITFACFNLLIGTAEEVELEE